MDASQTLITPITNTQPDSAPTLFFEWFIRDTETNGEILDEKSDRYLLLDKNPVAAQQESYNYSFLEERFLKILALWTPEEKKKLHKALKLYGTRFPHAIAKYVGTKNAVQVSQYLFHATALAQVLPLPEWERPKQAKETSEDELIIEEKDAELKQDERVPRLNDKERKNARTFRWSAVVDHFLRRGYMKPTYPQMTLYAYYSLKSWLRPIVKHLAVRMRSQARNLKSVTGRFVEEAFTEWGIKSSMSEESSDDNEQNSPNENEQHASNENEQHASNENEQHASNENEHASNERASHENEQYSPDENEQHSSHENEQHSSHESESEKSNSSMDIEGSDTDPDKTLSSPE